MKKTRSKKSRDLVPLKRSKNKHFQCSLSSTANLFSIKFNDETSVNPLGIRLKFLYCSMLTDLSRKFAVQEAACLVIGDPPHDPGGGEGVGCGGGGQRHQRLPERSPGGLRGLLLPRVVHLRLPVQERRENVLRDLSAKTGLVTRVPSRTRNQSPNFLTFKEPRNRFQGINSASLWILAGQYDNPIPSRFLAPMFKQSSSDNELISVDSSIKLLVKS